MLACFLDSFLIAAALTSLHRPPSLLHTALLECCQQLVAFVMHLLCLANSCYSLHWIAIKLVQVLVVAAQTEVMIAAQSWGATTMTFQSVSAHANISVAACSDQQECGLTSMNWNTSIHSHSVTCLFILPSDHRLFLPDTFVQHMISSISLTLSYSL